MGSLSQFIKGEGPFKTPALENLDSPTVTLQVIKDVINLAQQAAKGLAFVHENGSDRMKHVHKRCQTD